MKNISFLLVVLLFIPFINQAQIRLGIQTGRYIANDYQNIQPGKNISFEVSQLLKDHLIVTSHVNYGKNNYFETNTNIDYGTIDDDRTNAELSTIHVGLMAGYYYSFSKWLNITAQAGISSYTQIASYPYQFDNNSIWNTNSVFTDIAFPLKASIGFQPFKDFEIAFVAGCYLMPGSSLLGIHFGPQINLTF